MKPKNFLPKSEFLASLPRKRSGAGVILRNQKGEILLVKPSYKDHWSLPGGTVDAGESPAQTSIREAKEELGIAISVKSLVAVFYSSDFDRGGEAYQFIFDGGVLPKSTRITIDGDEILDAKFVAFNKIDSYVGQERAKRLKIYQKALAQGRVFFADDERVI